MSASNVGAPPRHPNGIDQSLPESGSHKVDSSNAHFEFEFPLAPAVTWFDGFATEIHNMDVLLAYAEGSRQLGRRSVCLIEDLNKEWVACLQNAWDIELSFFQQHSQSPSGNAQEAWAALYPENRPPVEDRSPSRYKHIDGMLEYHYLRDETVPRIMGECVMNPYATYHRALCVPEEPYSPFSHTKISYCRVHPYLCKYHGEE